MGRFWATFFGAAVLDEGSGPLGCCQSQVVTAAGLRVCLGAFSRAAIRWSATCLCGDWATTRRLARSHSGHCERGCPWQLQYCQSPDLHGSTQRQPVLVNAKTAAIRTARTRNIVMRSEMATANRRKRHRMAFLYFGHKGCVIYPMFKASRAQPSASFPAAPRIGKLDFHSDFATSYPRKQLWQNRTAPPKRRTTANDRPIARLGRRSDIR